MNMCGSIVPCIDNLGGKKKENIWGPEAFCWERLGVVFISSVVSLLMLDKVNLLTFVTSWMYCILIIFPGAVEYMTWMLKFFILDCFTFQTFLIQIILHIKKLLSEVWQLILFAHFCTSSDHKIWIISFLSKTHIWSTKVLLSIIGGHLKIAEFWGLHNISINIVRQIYLLLRRVLPCICFYDVAYIFDPSNGRQSFDQDFYLILSFKQLQREFLLDQAIYESLGLAWEKNLFMFVY